MIGIRAARACVPGAFAWIVIVASCAAPAARPAVTKNPAVANPAGPPIPPEKPTTDEEDEIADRAYALIEEGRHADAIPLFDTLRRPRPEDPRLLEDLIWSCVEVDACRPRLDDLLAELQGYLRDYPRDRGRRLLALDLLEMLGRHADLETATRQLNVDFPGVAEGWVILGELALGRDDLDAAAKAARRAREARFVQAEGPDRLRALERDVANSRAEKVRDAKKMARERRRELRFLGRENDLVGGEDY